MDDLCSRSSLRDRILNDLRNIIKQIYHESVNNELSPENKSYLCLTLVKNLDEALRHGLKQLHLGYWKPISEIVHTETLQSVDKLQSCNSSLCDSLIKGRTWITVSLKDDSFISYIQCLVNESFLDKFYEEWSILRSNDACNRFLSILSGLDNISFTFESDKVGKPFSVCNFEIKCSHGEKNVNSLNFCESKSNINLTASSTSLTSPVDSGVHTQDSTSDMEQLLDDKQIDIDLLNGNIPERVLLRKHKKDTKRHVSFHEDIIYKSPEKCRKLKWDSENLRYSWGGEQFDSSILKEVEFNGIKMQSNKYSTPVKGLDINERGTPEGEETPSKSEPVAFNNVSQKLVSVKRFSSGLNKQSKTKQPYKKYNPKKISCNFKNVKLDLNLIADANKEIERELKCEPKSVISHNEVRLNECLIKEMIRNQYIYKTYKLRDYLFILTNANIYLINKNLETKRISFKNIAKVLVYPDSHVFVIYESDDEFHLFVTGDTNLTNEILGRLELSMRRNRFELPEYKILSYDDLKYLKKTLIEKLAIGKKETLVYCGVVYLEKENDLLCSVLPTTKRGFLMYKDQRAGDSWIPGDFCLKNGILYLFGEFSNFPQLAINIATGCQSCNRTKNQDRPHTFQISLIEKELEMYPETSNFHDGNSLKRHGKTDSRRLFSGIRRKFNKLLTFGSSRGNGCVLEFAAANENELSEWLQMIIQASCADTCEEAHKEDLTQAALWVTTNSLIITNEIFTPQATVEVLSCAQLRDVASFRIGESEKDYFTVIEFICMEASSTSGDWILYFNSRKEMEKLKNTLENLWHFNDEFPCSHLNEGRLVLRCRRSQDSINANCWVQLLE